MGTSEWRKSLNIDKKEYVQEEGYPYAPLPTEKEEVDHMEKSATIIGIGNCGSQIAALAEKKYPELFDSVYINTSETDLNQVTSPDNKLRFKIGDPNQIEGSGKNRSRSKEFMQAHVKETLIDDPNFCDVIRSNDYCFIISSTAGGTGSGAAPAMYRLLSKFVPDVNYVLVFVLPRLNASLMEQGNTLEYLHEIYTVLGNNFTYMAYDNETTADMSPILGPAKVNEDIVEDIRILTSVDSMDAKYDNIDMRDMMNIISNPGRLLIARISKGLTEKNLEENRLDDMFIQAIKHSSNAETDRNNKVDRLGFITYMTDAAYRLYPDMSHLHEFLGEPFETYEHNAENISKRDADNFAYLIAGGLSPINDRTEKIRDRVDELKEAMATDDKMKFILEGDVSYNAIMEKRDQAAHFIEKDEFDVDDIFNEFN